MEGEIRYIVKGHNIYAKILNYKRTKTIWIVQDKNIKSNRQPMLYEVKEKELHTLSEAKEIAKKNLLDEYNIYIDKIDDYNE